MFYLYTWFCKLFQICFTISFCILHQITHLFTILTPFKHFYKLLFNYCVLIDLLYLKFYWYSLILLVFCWIKQKFCKFKNLLIKKGFCMVHWKIFLSPVVFDLPHHTQYEPESTSKNYTGCPKHTGTPRFILIGLRFILLPNIL